VFPSTNTKVLLFFFLRLDLLLLLHRRLRLGLHAHREHLLIVELLHDRLKSSGVSLAMS